MRRKNRQLKMTLTIPESYADDDSFMEALMDRLDEDGWAIKVDGQEVPISKMAMGDVEIEPEPEEED